MTSKTTFLKFCIPLLILQIISINAFGQCPIPVSGGGNSGLADISCSGGTIEIEVDANPFTTVPDFTFGGVTYTFSSYSGSTAFYTGASCPALSDENKATIGNIFIGASTTDCMGCFITDDLGNGGTFCDPFDTAINCDFFNENDNCYEIMDLTNGCGNNGYKCADLFFDVASLSACEAIGGGGDLSTCLANDSSLELLLSFQITQGSGCNAAPNSVNVYDENCQPQIGNEITITPVGDIDAELQTGNSGIVKYTVCTSSNNLSLFNLSVSVDGCCVQTTGTIQISEN